MTGLRLSSSFLTQLETLRIRTRRRLPGARAGSHASSKHGSSLEFADFRAYVPGDDPRGVDWALYARTDRMYVKLFEKEEDLFVHLFLDASASMGPSSGPRTHGAAATLVLALAYAALSSGDVVRVHRLGEPAPRSTPFLRGRRRLTQVREFLEDAEPTGRESLARSLARTLPGIGRRGKGILISDLLHRDAELEAVMAALRGAAPDPLVVHVVGEAPAPDVEGPVRIVDAESGAELEIGLDDDARRALARALERHRAHARALCHASGIGYARFDAGDDVERFVLAELRTIGLLRA